MSAWKGATLRRLSGVCQKWRCWSGRGVDSRGQQACMTDVLRRIGRGVYELFDGCDLFSVGETLQQS